MTLLSDDALEIAFTFLESAHPDDRRLAHQRLRDHVTTLTARVAELTADMEGGWENAWIAQVERLRACVAELERGLDEVS